MVLHRVASCFRTTARSVQSRMRSCVRAEAACCGYGVAGLASFGKALAEDFSAILVQNSHALGTDEGYPGKNGPGSCLCLVGAGFVVDDPAQDFRFMLLLRCSNDVNEVNHGGKATTVPPVINPALAGWGV